MDYMKKSIIVLFLFLICGVRGISQINPNVGSRLFNHQLAYGKRDYRSFYTMGYSFNFKASIASIELGYRPISVGIYIVQREPFTLNSQPVNYYYLANYVYQNKNMRRLFISGGIGPSIFKTYNGMVGKIGVDFRVTNSLYLSLHTFQEMYKSGNNNFTVGGKLYLF